MKKTILVSFIIPVYNVEAYLKRCLDSVIDIKNENIEIILIDDGSTDKSLRICEEYAQVDKRIILIKKENGGVSSARNIGIGCAKGEWISFIDSDDEIVPDVYDDLLKKINKTAEMWVLGCAYRSTDISYTKVRVVEGVWNNKEIETIKRGIFHQDIRFVRQIKEYGIYFKTCWGKFFKKEVILQNSIYFPENVSIGEDSIFNFIYLNYIEKVFYKTEYGYFYWQNGDSVMNQFKKDKGIECLNPVPIVYDLLKNKEMLDFAQFGVRQYLYALKIDWCNPDNFDGYYIRKSKALRERKSDLIDKAFKYAKLSQIRWEALPIALCAKWKWFFMCNFMLKIKAVLHINFK